MLIEFLFRLAFGLALGMAATSPRDVTSGYYRVHMQVLLGLLTLAALTAAAMPNFAIWLPLAGALVSYVGSVLWLYEQPRAGRIALMLVGGLALVGAWQALGRPYGNVPEPARLLGWADPVGGGLLLGATMAAMLLGHWYLNTPTMKLEPLRRLVRLMGAAVLLRMAICAAALVLQLSTVGPLSTLQTLLVLLRWLSALIGGAVLTVMVWQTLKVPNTQSATGLLYVAVIATFLGELTGQLLSAETLYPL